MAQISKGILGGFRGKVGTVVGSDWRGLNVMRSKPKFKKNRKFSERQLAQQARFGLIAKFLAPLRLFVEQGFRNYNSGQMDYNEALSVNIQMAIGGEYPEIAINYPKISLSKGMLAGVEEGTVTASKGGEWIFTWKNNAKPSELSGANDTDDLMILCHCPHRNESIFSIGEVSRSAGTYSIPFPEGFNGLQVHTWMAFKSRKTRKVSDSSYIGAGIVPQF